MKTPLLRQSHSLETMIHYTTDMLQTAGEEGLGRFLEQERTHLRRFLQCRINRKIASRLDASDVIQDVFFRAQRALPAYLANPVIPPLIWLRHLSQQVLTEIHRKHFRGIRSPFREAGNFEEPLVLKLANSSVSGLSKMAKHEVQSLIHEKLSEMSDLDREVLEMRHVDGYSLSEIAEMLSIPYETIKKRYYRAFNRLKDLFSQS